MKKTIIILFAFFVIVSCGDDPVAEAETGTLGGNCYPNKTCDDGLECSEGLCIKTADQGDTQESDDTTDSATDNDPADIDPADSAADTEPSGETDRECGNGVLDSGEVCEKGDRKLCSEIDSSYKTGDVECNDSCSGWLTVNCMASELEPLASFPARTHELTYLYNGVNAFNEMANQEDELWKSALFNASIAMSGATYSIPNPQANVHWIAAYYDSSALYFYQNSYLCDNSMNCQYATPAVLLGAALSELSAGKELSIGISDKHKVNMLIEDVTGEDNEDCVMLVGYGNLTVDSVKIAAENAGGFKFTTSKIGLYLPVATPEGDMSGELENVGFKICK